MEQNYIGLFQVMGQNYIELFQVGMRPKTFWNKLGLEELGFKKDETSWGWKSLGLRKMKQVGVERAQI